MKKLLMGIFGLMLLLPFGVCAEGGNITSVEDGENTTSTDALVGGVDVPVYNVNINWHPMVFEWKYNVSSEKYEWSVAPTCESIEIESEEIFRDNASTTYIYTDSSCSTATYTYDENITKYYYLHTPFDDGSSRINITDESINGRIIPSVSWTSTSEYDYVNGKFSYKTKKCTLMTHEEVVIDQFGTYTDSECKNEIPDDEVINTYEPGKYYNYQYIYETLNNQEIPDEGRIFAGIGGTGEQIITAYDYHLKLKLENKETPTKTPTTGDTIGTITISIKAAE